MRTVAWLNKKYMTLHRANSEPFSDEVRAELMPLCDQEAAQAEYDDVKRLLLGNARHLNAENERLREALMRVDAIATRCIGEPVTAIEDDLMRIGTVCRAALGPNVEAKRAAERGPLERPVVLPVPKREGL